MSPDFMKAGAIAPAFYLMRDTHFNAAQRRNTVSRATACGAKDFFDKLTAAYAAYCCFYGRRNSGRRRLASSR